MASLRLERPRSPRPLRVRPRVEPLEGRSLLSHVLPHSAPRTQAIHAIQVSPGSALQTPAVHAISVPLWRRLASQSVAIQVPSAFIGPGTSEVNVTLTRSSPAGAAGLRKRLTVDFTNFYESIPADPSAPGGHAIVDHLGFSKNVTFQPGQTSLTIPVPVPAVPAGSGSVDVVLGVNAHSLSWYNPTTSFTVFASVDKIPPTIVATKLTPQGMALTFSKPMDASTVQNINNYDVVDGSRETVALRAAVYDPATQTVTLMPTKPLDLASSYSVSPPSGAGPYYPMPGSQVLTDLEGNPIVNSFYYNSTSIPGYFMVGVGPGLPTA